MEPSFRVRPVVPPVNLGTHAGGRPRAEVKRRQGPFPSWPGLLPPGDPVGPEPGRANCTCRSRKEPSVLTHSIARK